MLLLLSFRFREFSYSEDSFKYKISICGTVQCGDETDAEACVEEKDFAKSFVAGKLSAQSAADSDLGSGKGVRFVTARGDEEGCSEGAARTSVVSITCGSDEKITVLLVSFLC